MNTFRSPAPTSALLNFGNSRSNAGMNFVGNTVNGAVNAVNSVGDATIRAANSVANAANAAVKTVIAKIFAGNFNKNGVLNQSVLNANTNYMKYKNRNNVKRSIITHSIQLKK